MRRECAVAGEPLHRYCDGRRLTLPERLRLFLEVCEPVAFAHRQLVSGAC